MSDTPCFATGTDQLPRSVYFKNQSLLICRGTPSQMILEMVSSEQQLTVREALERLVSHISSTRNINIQLPWQAPDEVLANLFIKVLLEIGILEPTPLS
jgi:hypothetical protein